MHIKKSTVSNLLFLGLIIVLLFTPIGTYIKVHVTRLLAMSPSVETTEERKVLENYNWSLVSLEGEQLEFSDLKGKVVLVNFWATWCPPCIAEMPSLQKLYKDYGDRVVFVFVSNEEKKTLAKFLEKHQYTLPVFNSFSEVPKHLISKSIPATYLISKDGGIVIDEKGAANWNSDKMRSTLDKLVSE
ncbi:TlpA family protein disulfide reductase [Galbibacter orientalis]|uniref:Thiol-disulfide isomerase-like thioredoxin n=1 Tax=Galbibacter orientalis DSM 19592 TaxID=926559 RepID=I3C6D9_9FLAO|nr:TlpA disulfide reductase family protein [Galbibacter orientalis]EIJ39182.1 thiol-disulfide isomerase-like thioredoxin [Galbibacter orientalis DSM 19592]